MHKITPRRSTLIALAVSAALSASAAANGQKAIDVPAGDLTLALELLARQSGVELVYSPGQLKGLRTEGVQGALSPEDAVAKLLKGTPLKLRADASGLLLISDASAVMGTGAVLAAATTDAESEELQEVVVRGIQFRYDVPSSATKLPMDPRDIPQSLTLVTEDVMDFASIKRFDDIYRVDASAGSTHRRDGFPQSFYRGFDSQGVNAIRIDGFRFIGNTDLDLVGFERFELVKGPASALFGQNTLGGTLNAVTKQPQGERAGSMSLEGGSHDLKRGELDFTGPIDDAGRWKYRIVGAYEDAGTYVDIANHQATTIVPSISFDATDQTRFVMTGYYNKQSVVTDWGTGLQGVDPDNGVFRVLPAPRSRFFGQPWNDSDLEAYIVTLRMEHEFNDNWNLRVAAQRNDTRKFRLNCSADGNANAQGVVEGGCWTYYDEGEVALHSGEVNLIGKVEAFGHEHTVFFGVDYAQNKDTDRFGYDYIDDAGNGLAFGSSIGYDLTRPVGVIPRPSIGSLYSYQDNIETTIYSGLTAQVLIHPTDRLSLLLAGRYNKDRVSKSLTRAAGSIPDLEATPLEPDTDDIFDLEKFVGQAGVTFEVTPTANVYLNWGQTYEPNFGLQFDPANPGGGIRLAPEEGEQLEAGLKMSVLDNRMDLTLAAYTMERSGITETDRQNPDFSLLVGTQRSRGVEIGAAGELLPGWEIYASAALLDSEFTEGEFTGNQSANAPKRALSFFTSYQWQGGPLQGFGVGMGYVFKDGLATYGRVFAPDEAPQAIRFDFGDINELDLRLFYNTERWEAYIAARDLLDDLYYAPVRFNEFRWGMSVNPGRTITAGLTYKLF